MGGARHASRRRAARRQVGGGSPRPVRDHSIRATPKPEGPHSGSDNPRCRFVGSLASQPPSGRSRSKARVTGQARLNQLATTMWVVSESGSCTMRKETASFLERYAVSVVCSPEAEAVAQCLRGDVVELAVTGAPGSGQNYGPTPTTPGPMVNSGLLARSGSPSHRDGRSGGQGVAGSIWPTRQVFDLVGVYFWPPYPLVHIGRFTRLCQPDSNF